MVLITIASDESGFYARQSGRVGMKIVIRIFCFVGVLLLLSTHRLPAPIQEVPESPTPPPTQQARKKAPSKSKAIESESKTKTAPKPSAKPMEGPARFAGTWIGTIKGFGIWGDVEYTLVVDPSGTSVIEKSRLGTGTRKVSSDGATITWRSGWFKEYTWTLTPNADGKTAIGTLRGPFVGNPSAIFRRE
jgi:hypothetical protein